MNRSKRNALALLVSPMMSGCVSRLIDGSQNLYARPDALELPLDERYDRFKISVLGKFIFEHDWPSNQSPPRWPLKNPPEYFASNRSGGSTFIAHGIQEWGDSTWSTTDPPRKMDIFVREHYSEPMSEIITTRAPNGDLKMQKGKFIGMKTYTGHRPIAQAFWGSSAHHLSLAFRRCSIQDWLDHMSEFAGGAYLQPDALRSNERIGNVDWHVFRAQLQTRRPNHVSGPFEHRFAQIGDTAYTIALTMGAASESLQHPQRHALVQKIFRHLTETFTVTRAQA